MGKDTFLVIGDQTIAIEDIAAKFGANFTRYPTAILCKRIGAGVLKARAVLGETDSPSIDVSLALDSGRLVPISFTEQPAMEEPKQVTTYVYGNNDEYVAYIHHDTREEDEIENDPRQTCVTVSGDPGEVVEIVRENQYSYVAPYIVEPYIVNEEG